MLSVYTELYSFKNNHSRYLYAGKVVSLELYGAFNAALRDFFAQSTSGYSGIKFQDDDLHCFPCIPFFNPISNSLFTFLFAGDGKRGIWLTTSNGKCVVALNKARFLLCFSQELQSSSLTCLFSLITFLAGKINYSNISGTLPGKLAFSSSSCSLYALLFYMCTVIKHSMFAF